MSRIRGLERINRNPAHNKTIIRSIFGIEVRRGKLKPIMECINETYKEILKQNVAARYTVSDFFDKSPEVFKYISSKLEFLESDIKYRGYDINIGREGFDNYEGINPAFLREHKDLMIAKLNELDLV